MENITIWFKNDEKEFVNAMRLYYNRKLKAWFDVGLGLAAIVCGSVLWYSHGYSASWLSLIGAGLFVFLMLWLINYHIPVTRFRQEPKFKDEYQLTFSEAGINFKTNHFESKIDWSLYSKVRESDELYLLIYGRSLFTLIPKRAFANAKQQETFRKIIESKAIKIVRV